MARGKRYETERKLNYQKVFAVVIAIAVVIMFIFIIRNVLKEREEITKDYEYFALYSQNKWGVINQEGEEVIQPSYQEMIVIPDKTKDVFICTYNVNEETGTYHLKADELIGTEIYLDFASVGATINIMLAAVKAKGRTVIENAAKEPEIIDVANLLTKMGARIRGVGTDTITIDGVEHMHGAYHEIIPDRIEAGTFLIIAAAIGEKMVIQNIIPQHLDALISKLKEMGIKMEKIGDSIVVYGNDGNLKPVEVQTQIYPGFATDLQQPLTTLLTQGNGQSKVSETIYKERFKHCAQLNKMGADIELGEACAYVKGKTPLHGARVMATDLRCGAALVVAGLMAEGKTEITNVYHIDRGYDNIDHKLITLGAHITRYMIDD